MSTTSPAMTPGPWRVVTSDPRLRSARIVGIVPADETKAECGIATVNRLYDEWEANAKAIAALPDLVAALLRLADGAADAKAVRGAWVRDEALGALAKAGIAPPPAR